MRVRVPRSWVAKKVGEGYTLVHRDSGGYVFVVEPSNKEQGDPLSMLRFYIATNAMPGDLYYEEGRPYIVQPRSVEEDTRKEAVRVLNERLLQTSDGKLHIVMAKGKV